MKAELCQSEYLRSDATGAIENCRGRCGTTFAFENRAKSRRLPRHRRFPILEHQVVIIRELVVKIAYGVAHPEIYYKHAGLGALQQAVTGLPFLTGSMIGLGSPVSRNLADDADHQNSEGIQFDGLSRIHSERRLG